MRILFQNYLMEIGVQAYLILDWNGWGESQKAAMIICFALLQALLAPSQTDRQNWPRKISVIREQESEAEKRIASHMSFPCVRRASGDEQPSDVPRLR